MFFPLILDFSELCQFCCSAGVLPAWCVYTHWHRGKTEKDKNSEFYKIFRKNTIFNEHPVPKAPMMWTHVFWLFSYPFVKLIYICMLFILRMLCCKLYYYFFWKGRFIRCFFHIESVFIQISYTTTYIIFFST